MKRKTRTKVKKGLIIAGIVIGIAIIIGIIIAIRLYEKKEISYDYGITSKNYFTQITIDLGEKEVKRDNIETTLKEEFNISDEQESLAFSSPEEMRKLLSNSVFDISEDGQIFTIKDLWHLTNVFGKLLSILLNEP